MSSLLKRKHVLAAHFGGAARSYQATIVADGAIAYWPLDDPSGTTALDKVGTRHGTISGGVTLNQAGVNGSKCMVFNGTSGRIVTLPLTITTACTIEAWIKATSVPPNPHAAYLSTRVAGNTGDPIYTGMNNAPPGTYTYLGGQWVGAKLLNDSSWHHVVTAITGTTVTVYTDNIVDVATVASSRTIQNQGPLGIAHDELASLFFPGSLQDIAIYNRALTPAEIQSHYTKRLVGAPFSGLVSTDQLVSLWDFDTDFQDKVGTNHLTNNNGVTRVPGKLGNAASFNGVNQYLSHADPNQLGNEDFTYCLWFKRATVGSYILLGKDHQTDGRSYFLEITSPGTLHWSLAISLNYAVLANDTNWHFVVCGFNAATDQAFLQMDNGPLESGTWAAGPTQGITPVRFGSRAYAGAEQYFNGLIDQPLLFRRVLSAAERTAMWNSGNGLKY